MIEAVFFDVDDTLVDFDTAARAAFHAVFGESADYAAWITLSRQWYPRHPKELSWADMRVGRTAAFLQTLGRADDPDGIEARRLGMAAAACRLFPDAADCLGALRRSGRELGVITNSESVHQRAKLRAVGLGDAFDAVVISGEVGVAKPERAIFEHACAAVGVAPQAALHVGDRLDLDALGASEAGLRGVWLDRRAEANGERRVSVVTTLAEVPGLLG
jgi:putative hydrolase of the HAD superfamily